MTRVKELTVGQVYRNRNRNGYRYLEDAEPEVVKLERVSDGGDATGVQNPRVRGRVY